jgi:hypothetical protein
MLWGLAAATKVATEATEATDDAIYFIILTRKIKS